ncbi:MAG: DUF3422 domain-containing protein [Porticoccaceae bacterium]|nr:DUF3422 domain-containing protein [Porticoccaceae bacterium]
MINFHSLKDSLIDELHNRPFPVIQLPAQVSNIVVLEPADRDSEIAGLKQLAEIHNMTPPDDGVSCYYQSSEDFDLRWERHNEFSTYTLICNKKLSGTAFESGFSHISDDWLSTLSGQVISANHIDLRSAGEAPDSPEDLDEYFDGRKLIGSKIYDGNAKLWTSMRSHSDGFSRTLLVDQGVDPSQAGRAVRNLLEISTYRSMTLLALPTARELLPEISTLEQSLSATSEKLKLIETMEDEQNLMTELIAEATQVERLIADNSFRFSATEAYFNLTETRLNMLREEKIPTIRTLKQFHVRRFIPAYNTCMSVVKRKQNLSQRIGRTSELLHSRLQLSLEDQNQRLLASMDKRSKIQLRLQQTVEGLSVVAITYYSMGLLRLMVEPLPVERYLYLSDSAVVAIATPIIFFSALMVVRRIRKKLGSHD